MHIKKINDTERALLVFLQSDEVNFVEFGFGEVGDEGVGTGDFVFGEVLLVDAGEIFAGGTLGSAGSEYDKDLDDFAADFVGDTDAGALGDKLGVEGDFLDIGWVDIVAISNNHPLEATLEEDGAALVSIANIAGTEVFFAADGDEGVFGFFGVV